MSKLSKVATTPVAVVGLDVSDRISHFCGLDQSGEVVKQGKVANTKEALQEWAGTMAGAVIVLEAGAQSHWMAREIMGAGVRVLVADPRELRWITHSNRKSDRADAEKLARLALADERLLRPVAVRDEQRELDLQVVRARDGLVRARTLAINQVRALAKQRGMRIPRYESQAFGRRAIQEWGVRLGAGGLALARSIDHLSGEIIRLEEELRMIAVQRYPETQRLQKVDGVGELTAIAFVLTIGDATRFVHSRDVGAYLGLTPKQKQSGNRDPQLGITKTGNSYLRRLLIQCAHALLGACKKDSALRDQGLALAQRGHKNRALVAVARKLATLLHRLWVSGQEWMPYPNAA